MENSTDSLTGRLRCIYSTLSIYLARVELVKLSEMPYIPRHSEFGGFFYARDPRAIPTYIALISTAITSARFLWSSIYREIAMVA